MRRNVYSSSVFPGVDLFALNLTWTGSSSINYSWHQKTRDNGLPDGEDHIRLCSFWHNTEVWRTDRRICRSIYSRFAARCNNYLMDLYKIYSRHPLLTVYAVHIQDGWLPFILVSITLQWLSTMTADKRLWECSYISDGESCIARLCSIRPDQWSYPS